MTKDRDVVIVDLTRGALPSEARVFASSEGTQTVVETAQRYQSLARIPSGSWRRLHPSEVASFEFLDRATCAAAVERHRAIVILRWPKRLLAKFEELRSVYLEYRTVAAVRRFARGARIAATNADLGMEARRWIGSDDDFDVQGVNVSETGLLTTTLVEPPFRTFVGLHCDSFGGRINPRTDIDPTRLCVNLGEEPRYFLFANLAVDEALSRMPNFKSASSFRTGYLTSNPTCPIYRLTILPGEAYVAPTANLIHDATTVGKSEVDITYGMVGHFEVNRMTEA